jgi:hypothetical protein
MKLDKYVETLAPTLAKEDLLEDNRVTLKELETVTAPLYKSASEFFKSGSFKSDVVSAYDREFKKAVKGNKNIVLQIADAIPTVEKNVKAISGMLEKNFSDVVAAGGLSYSQANLMQFSEYCAFWSRYAIRLLNFLCVHETSEYEDSGVTKGQLKDSLSPAEVAWVGNELQNFLAVWPVVTAGEDKVTKQLESIPDVTITEDNYKTLSATLGENKLDPMATKYISAKRNIFLYLGKWFVEGQVKRYNAAKAEKEAVELRLINLKALEKGNPSASTQKQIQYYESKVQKLEADIAQMEKDYA